jgi:hypothetical protein
MSTFSRLIFPLIIESFFFSLERNEEYKKIDRINLERNIFSPLHDLIFDKNTLSRYVKNLFEHKFTSDMNAD